MMQCLLHHIPSLVSEFLIILGTYTQLVTACDILFGGDKPN
jgi:hypothetical protein